MDKAKTLMTQYSEYRYSSSGSASGEMGTKLAVKILQTTKKLQDVKAICDLGCGNGYLAHFLSSSGYRLTGVDLSESGILQAQAAYKECEFFQAPIDQELPSKLGFRSFDMVLAREVIEHLYRPSDLLETASKLIRPQGYLLLTTPYHGYFKNLILSAAGLMDRHWNPLWDGGHIKFFSVKTLTQLVKKHGFEPIKFAFFGRLPWLWKSMICLCRKTAK